MAQFITLPTVTPTGFGQLGQAIYAGASDYAAEKRRSEDEARVRANQLEDAARRRSEQLADVQSARDYSDKVYSNERINRVKDTEDEKMFAAKTEMMRLGYLQPGDFDNQDAVKAALTKMHGDGLLTKYQGALASGDLTYADLQSGDDSKIASGLSKYSARLAKDTSRIETSVTDAQATANSLQQQYDQTVAQASQLEQDLARPVEEQIAPANQNEIQNLALQLAQQSSGGKPPSQKEIAAQLPLAQQQLQQMHLEAAITRKQQTQERVRLLKDQAQSLGVRLNTLATRNVFPSSKPGAAGPSALIDSAAGAAPSPSGPASIAPASPNARQAAIQATISAARGAPQSSAVAPPGAAPAPQPSAPPVPGSQPGNAPWWSIKGLLQRAPGVASSSAGVIPDALALPGRAIDQLGRVASAGVNGVYSGDFSMPPKGLIEMAGDKIGDALVADKSPQEIAEENDVLDRAPDSARAYEIRAERGIPQPPNQFADPGFSRGGGTATPAQPAGNRTTSNANGATPFPWLAQNAPWWARQAAMR